MDSNTSSSVRGSDIFDRSRIVIMRTDAFDQLTRYRYLRTEPGGHGYYYLNLLSNKEELLPHAKRVLADYNGFTILVY
jgi:hypothetical protein